MCGVFCLLGSGGADSTAVKKKLSVLKAHGSAGRRQEE